MGLQNFLSPIETWKCKRLCHKALYGIERFALSYEKSALRLAHHPPVLQCSYLHIDFTFTTTFPCASSAVPLFLPAHRLYLHNDFPLQQSCTIPTHTLTLPFTSIDCIVVFQSIHCTQRRLNDLMFKKNKFCSEAAWLQPYARIALWLLAFIALSPRCPRKAPQARLIALSPHCPRKAPQASLQTLPALGHPPASP